MDILFSFYFYSSAKFWWKFIQSLSPKLFIAWKFRQKFGLVYFESFAYTNFFLYVCTRSDRYVDFWIELFFVFWKLAFDVNVWHFVISLCFNLLNRCARNNTHFGCYRKYDCVSRRYATLVKYKFLLAFYFVISEFWIRNPKFVQNKPILIWRS